MRSRLVTLGCAALIATGIAVATTATATAQSSGSDDDGPACRVVEVAMTPSPDLQIVVWLEDAAGNFVDTLFITELTGTYGLGNRPGIME
ncbi:MAG: hypothetical protein AAGC55_12840, partial [Myxococcota bacterium]